jgi:hypothetical protein
MRVFLFRRKNRVKVTVFKDGDGYNAMATDNKLGVYNCYGSTEEAAKEIALYKFRKFQEEQTSKES